MTIISFDNRFIFVKTTKTAGTSIEVHLSQQCGPGDIVTPITPRNNQHFPRNFITSDFTYYNHMSALEIRKHHEDIFSTYFKFCFERHPVDKCLSHFGMLLNSPDHRSKEGPKSWEEYIDRELFPIDHLKYTDSSGNLIVDRLYKYEDLHASLLEVSGITGIRYDNLDVREKSTFRYAVPTLESVLQRRDQVNRIMRCFTKTLTYVEY